MATDGSSASGAVFFWVRTAAPTSPSDVTLIRSYWPPQEGARYGIDDPWQGNEGHPELLKLIERDVRRESEALAAHIFRRFGCVSRSATRARSWLPTSRRWASTHW